MKHFRRFLWRVLGDVVVGACVVGVLFVIGMLISAYPDEALVAVIGVIVVVFAAPWLIERWEDTQ